MKLQFGGQSAVLKYVASLFDPFAMISSFVFFGKMILQELWKVGVSWDENLLADLEAQACQWWGEVKVLTTFKFP